MNRGELSWWFSARNSDVHGSERRTTGLSRSSIPKHIKTYVPVIKAEVFERLRESSEEEEIDPSFFEIDDFEPSVEPLDGLPIRDEPTGLFRRDRGDHHQAASDGRVDVLAKTIRKSEF